MRTLLFATRNRGKVAELRRLLSGIAVEVKSISEWPMELPEVAETGATFAANAALKALAVSRAAGVPALADDSGLCVTALGDRPGVHSARYAGATATDAENNAQLLEELIEVPAGERKARFESVLAFADVAGALGDEVRYAAGTCEGRIMGAPRGTGGFGYDPLFFADALGKTFGESTPDEKSKHSHRGRAMAGMKPIIEAYFNLANREGSG